jgi:hypothetical protein
LYRFARDEEIDLNELRTRLHKMSNEDLVRFGKAARFMFRDKLPRQGVRELSWRKRERNGEGDTTSRAQRGKIE